MGEFFISKKIQQLALVLLLNRFFYFIGLFVPATGKSEPPKVNLLGLLTTDIAGFSHLLINNTDLKIRLIRNSVKVCKNKY